MDPQARIWVAGRTTMLGRAIEERLAVRGFRNVIADEPDLGDGRAVQEFFDRSRPDFIFVAAGKTAGIIGNQRHPADLMIDNLLIAGHVIPAAWQFHSRKLFYLSSSCTYPKLAPQPLAVDSLWTGSLEPTSSAYAVAKLAGVRLAEAYRQQHGAPFITAIGADAYGPYDDFSPVHSHVVAALMRRMHEARRDGSPSIEVWGTGSPRREFIYIDDLADACIFAMEHYDDLPPINLGTGTATSIAELATLIREVVGYSGDLRFDATKPDGMPFKGLDSTTLARLGWKPQVDLRTGLRRTYDWFRGQTAV